MDVVLNMAGASLVLGSFGECLVMFLQHLHQLLLLD